MLTYFAHKQAVKLFQISLTVVKQEKNPEEINFPFGAGRAIY